MSNIDYKLNRADACVAEGADIDIIDAWSDATEPNTVYLMLHEAGSNLSAKVRVFGNVVVGGKNYLIFQNLESEAECLVVARLISPKRLVAMDKDRFSSLRKAFALCLEENLVGRGEELVLIFGSLPVR